MFKKQFGVGMKLLYFDRKKREYEYTATGNSSGILE